MMIEDRLLNGTDSAADRLDAVAMLCLLKSLLQVSSAHMNGQHQWRLRGNGWPMTHAVGETSEEALLNVLAEIRRAEQE